jgi:hypothetical protein
MSDDNASSWGSTKTLVFAALAGGAAAVAGLGAWYLRGRLADPPVAGEVVVLRGETNSRSSSQTQDLVPESVRSLWRWHAWNGAVRKEDFASIMKEPLQEFCKVQLLSLLKVRRTRPFASRPPLRVHVQGAVKLLDGNEQLTTSVSVSLTRSQLAQDNPWIVELIDSLEPALAESLRIDVPDHLAERVFALFTSNADNKITKKEFITKVRRALLVAAVSLLTCVSKVLGAANWKP